MRVIFKKHIPTDRLLDVFSNDDKTIGFDIEEMPPVDDWGGYIELNHTEAKALADAIYSVLKVGFPVGGSISVDQIGE